MVHRIRWAREFVNALGANASEGLLFLQALVPSVKAIPGALFGHVVARRFEKMMLESLFDSNCPAKGTVPEQVVRFISLLVEKDHFRDIDTILLKIEELIDRKNGILTVTVEAASPMDAGFEEEFRQRIAQAMGVAEIKMKTRHVPGLLGGYRLQCGGLFVDASLRGQMEKMQAMLGEAVLHIHDAAPSPVKE